MQPLEFLSLFFGVSTAVAVGGAVIPLVRTGLEKLVGHQFDRKLEQYRYDLRVREQAAKTAEYLAYAWQLHRDDDKSVYIKANQLGWELALILPPEVYIHVRDAIVVKDHERNLTTALVAVRKHLLGSQAGSLAPDDIAFHSPGADGTRA